MYKVTCGPTVYFDVDDTLVMWEIPNGFEEELVTIHCRDYVELLAPNKHNIKLLQKLASRGHSIVVWSGGGADWAEAVVKALELEDYVEVVSGKPQYYIDDIANAKEWIGKHGYFKLDGTRVHGDNFPRTEED
jgi:hydroxymethylpyrimidine pyrophosphatase-like HAD family hydrolase